MSVVAMPAVKNGLPVGPPYDTDAVYRAYRQQVARWLRRLLGPKSRSSGDLEELVQEVFLRVHRALPQFRGESLLSTWLFRITLHVVYSHRRKAKLRSWFEWHAPETVTSTLPSDDRGPSGSVERKDASLKLYRGLEKLSDTDRTLLVLFELEDHSAEQLSELTGLTVNAVWIRLSRARKLLVQEINRLEGVR